MFPETFIKRLETQGYIDSDPLLEAMGRPSPVSIRLNPLKWSRVPAGSDRVPWCSTGHYLTSRPSFTADPLFHSGCYYPQEASGMFLEEIFNQCFSGRDHLRVLDLCGAPGSKSTHLSALLGSKGYLIANEVIRSRAAVLAENITRWGIPNTLVTNNDPAGFSRLEGFFDLIVVDAPCSGEGMFRDPVARREWSEKNAELCQRRQRRIISDVWPALKENGILVYSTCTFNPAENEENIKWLTGNMQAENLRINISSFPEITEINYEGITGYGFIPGRVKGDGFFVSVVRKNESSGSLKIIKRKITKQVSKEEQKTAEELTGGVCGTILKTGDVLYHTPPEHDEYLTLSGLLRIVNPGTGLFRLVNGETLPEHSLGVSVLPGKNIYPVIELNYDQAVSYLKKENVGIDARGKGWYIAAYRGCSLGFLKSTGTRFNNYLPVNLRIRMTGEALKEKQILEWY
ncbi:MAG TPA: rRNA cytosine-C5-methyltransferase [Bacteroidales bacterium]|nr:rRNA cytosine-C5-methyltransferase [Bacteroidales bacterium]